jgi:hypothetical protein
MAIDPTVPRPLSRRDLMRRAATATAAGAAVAASGSLLLSGPAEAAGSLTLGDNTNAASAPTGLAVSDGNPSYGLGVTDHGLNTLPDTATFIGHANASYNNAILGFHEARQGIGVMGIAGGADATGVQGTAHATGSVGVRGDVHDGAGVFGTATSGVGVVGFASPGRGGEFVGKAAQVRLVPSTATTHPKHGQVGDLFVDKSGRLWFCKGVATWKQLA